MTTNLELAKRLIENCSDSELKLAVISMARRLDIIANMKPEIPVGQLQLIAKSDFFKL